MRACLENSEHAEVLDDEKQKKIQDKRQKQFRRVRGEKIIIAIRFKM